MKFTLNVTPVPKGRPRATVRNGHAILYTPKETREAEAIIRQLVTVSEKFEADIPLSLKAVFYVPKPNVKREYPTVKPDLDNYVKLLIDSLQGILFPDDKQIVDIQCSKRYGEPRIEVEIDKLKSEQE